MIKHPILASMLTGAFLFPSGLVAEEPDILGRVLGAALTEGNAYGKLTYLTDRIGHRLSGSKSLDKAIEWAVAEMNRDGLDKVWTEKVMVPRWVRGVENGRILSPAEHRMAIIALGMSDPTPEEGVTAEVLEVASFEEVRAAGERLKGKIVFYNKPIYANGGEERGYGAAAGLRHRGAVEAAKHGAVGMLIRSLGTAN
ncbi:MAG: peptidase M28 family protein, partial [Vicinamibacteria bacterium]